MPDTINPKLSWTTPILSKLSSHLNRRSWTGSFSAIFITDTNNHPNGICKRRFHGMGLEYGWNCINNKIGKIFSPSNVDWLTFTSGTNEKFMERSYWDDRKPWHDVGLAFQLVCRLISLIFNSADTYLSAI